MININYMYWQFCVHCHGYLKTLNHVVKHETKNCHDDAQTGLLVISTRKTIQIANHIAETFASRPIFPIDYYIGSFTIRVLFLIVLTVDINSRPSVSEKRSTNFWRTSRLSVKSKTLQDVLCTRFISNTLLNLTQPYFDMVFALVQMHNIGIKLLTRVETSNHKKCTSGIKLL